MDIKDILSTPQRVSNVNYLIGTLKDAGITNDYMIAGILGVVGKESNFKPQSEISYRNTSAERIRNIFSVFQNMTDAEINAIKVNDVQFFNMIYGGKFGNAPNEGYTYRGRGYNQLTFKSNYASIGNRIGRNLVADPDMVNNGRVAAEVLVDYFVREFDKYPQKVTEVVGSSNPNDVQSLESATELAAWANSGWKSRSGSVVRNAVQYATPYAQVLYPYVKSRFFLPSREVILAAAAIALVIAGIIISVNYLR